jgi:hypothetical protein
LAVSFGLPACRGQGIAFGSGVVVQVFSSRQPSEFDEDIFEVVLRVGANEFAGAK